MFFCLWPLNSNAFLTWSLNSNAVIGVLFSLAIFELRKREFVALLFIVYLMVYGYYCSVSFPNGAEGVLQYVIEVFHDHTHLLFYCWLSLLGVFFVFRP